MHQADRHAAEHRLTFLLPDVFLQLDEPVRHVVEGFTELSEFVLRFDDDPLFEVPCGEGACPAHQGEDRVYEAAPPEVAEDQHCQQRRGNGERQLPLQGDRDGERLCNMSGDIARCRSLPLRQ